MILKAFVDCVSRLNVEFLRNNTFIGSSKQTVLKLLIVSTVTIQ